MSNEAAINTSSGTANGAISVASVIDSLHWRYAAKRYDTTKKLSPEQRQCIKDALRLAPSSFGLQPWKFVHVADPSVREQLKAAAYGQPQLTEASDVFVLASYAAIDEAFVEKYIASVAETRGVPVDTLQKLHDTLIGAIKGKTPEELNAWLSRQVYIPLGVALAAAAMQRIDASPMEGFDVKKFNEILGLDAQGLIARAILAVGFRSAEDDYQNMKKVRFNETEVCMEK